MCDRLGLEHHCGQSKKVLTAVFPVFARISELQRIPTVPKEAQDITKA